jgi:hypothetical protein
MQKFTAQIGIDLGNSSTKISVRCGDNVRTSEIPNQYGLISDDVLLQNPDYNSKNSKAFRMPDGTIIAIGDLCTKEMGSASMRPTSIDKKYESIYSQYALRLAFMQGYEDVSAMTGFPVDDLEITWSVAVCIPALDKEFGEEPLKKMVLGITELDFLIPAFSTDVHINPAVAVVPEGFGAFCGCMFENRKKYRAGMAAKAKQMTLVCDCGDGTTDLCIVSAASVSQKSLHSIPIGGNNITQKLKQTLAKKYGGRTVSDESIRQAVYTGILKMGSREFPVQEEVDAVRAEVAMAIAEAIKQYFDGINVSVNEIENIILCGGGAITDDKEDKDFIEYLKEALQVQLPYASFLDLPVIRENFVRADGGTESRQKKMNPRYLNVIGARISAEITG